MIIYFLCPQETECLRLFFHVCAGAGGASARVKGSEARIDPTVVLRLLRALGFHVEGIEAGIGGFGGTSGSSSGGGGGSGGGSGDRLKGFSSFVTW